MVEKEKKIKEHAHFILHSYMIFSSWKMLWIWRKCVWSFLHNKGLSRKWIKKNLPPLFGQCISYFFTVTFFKTILQSL